MMADSTVFGKSSDVAKLKVVELKKELKSRGLSTVGDKSELTTRLQTAVSKDSLAEDTLDSDDLDSDGVLDDDVDLKFAEELKVEDPNESEVSASTNKPETTSEGQSDSAATLGQILPTRTLKRRLPPVITSTESINEDKLLSPDSESPPKRQITTIDINATSAKKVVLNRAIITVDKVESSDKSEDAPKTPVVVKAPVDAQSRLELRAKRFGLPPTEAASKDARKARFGLTAVSSTTPATPASPASRKIAPAAAASLDVLKKRAERFGISVSKVMVDVENQEKIEKRKAKFGLVKT